MAHQNEYSNTWNGGVPDNTLALNFATGGFLPDSIWINQLSSFLKSSLERKSFYLLSFSINYHETHDSLWIFHLVIIIGGSSSYITDLNCLTIAGDAENKNDLKTLKLDIHVHKEEKKSKYNKI